IIPCSVSVDQCQTVLASISAKSETAKAAVRRSIGLAHFGGTMAEEIRTRFKSVRLHNHWPCTVCGGQTSGVNVLNESPDGTVRVCEHCLQAGHIDERLAMTRLIAQIHRQAIAATNGDRLAQQAADATRQSRWRKADGVIAAGILQMIAVAAVIAALGCVLVLWW